MINPEHEAECLIQDLGLEHLINPQTLCDLVSTKEYNIEYHEQSLEKESLCGVSIGNSSGAQILINSNISNFERRLFTAAHEIGHVVLHIQKGVQSKFNCGINEIQPNNDKNQNKLETEANQFASALLMPKVVITTDIRNNDVTWRLVQKIAEKYKTSLEATARRIINITKEQCALIIHKDNQMWTPIKSASFPCFIPKTVFPKNLFCLSLNKDDQLDNKLEECDLFDWGLNLDNKQYKCYYSAIHDTVHNRIMTLWAVEQMDENDGDEWEDARF